jgi:hypothetical protein
MWMMFKMTMSSTFGENATMRGAIMATEVQAWTCVVSLAVAGLWFWVANLLTQRLLDRNVVLANSPPLQYAYQAPTSGTRPVQSAPAPVLMPTTTAPAIATMSANPPPAQPINAQTPSPFDEDAVYEVVANEMDSGKMDKGLWTRLFAEQDGDEKKTKIAYIKQRTEKLMAAEQARVLENQRQQSEQIAHLEWKKEHEERERIKKAIGAINTRFEKLRSSATILTLPDDKTTPTERMEIINQFGGSVTSTKGKGLFGAGCSVAIYGETHHFETMQEFGKWVREGLGPKVLEKIAAEHQRALDSSAKLN